MNLANTIIPKSDQLNADDLISGPRTIRITDVRAGNAEQPVSIHYEGDNGRPYKPCKSMRRVLVALWGDDAKAYIGRRLTLYRDTAVKFGSDEVGGIRISHASHLAETATLALTVTRGKRKPYRVEPLADDEPAVDIQALSDVGESKAREGIESLRAWWATLPTAAKSALKPKLDGDWKRLAQDADAGKAGAP